MQGFKIGFLAGLLVGALALFGFFGLDRLKSGEDYLVKESQLAQVENYSPEVNLQVEDANLVSEVENTIVPDISLATVVETPSNTDNNLPANDTLVDLNKITAKDQELITALEKLITDKVIMDLKSRGTRVGTIQEFLNLYENKTLKIDNDYGVGTKERVKNFQKNTGLSADGQTGPGTYQKMIDWLKTN